MPCVIFSGNVQSQPTSFLIIKALLGVTVTSVNLFTFVILPFEMFVYVLLNKYVVSYQESMESEQIV